MKRMTHAVRSALAVVSGETMVTIAMSGRDIKALKRLSAVSRHIADCMGNERAQRDQERITSVLDDTIHKIERATAKGRAA